MDQATPITTAAAVDLSSVGIGLAVDGNYAKVALTTKGAPLPAAVEGASAEPSDATDGFLSHPALLAPYRHIARLPTKDVRVHFLRALVAWMPVDPNAFPIEGTPEQGSPAGIDNMNRDSPSVAGAEPGKDDTISRGQCNSAVQFERACGVGGLLHHLCTATRVLHTVSLLYDDIEDDSDTRRGEPCAHVRYGVAWTLNAASAATFAALHELPQCAADAAAAVVLHFGTTECIPLPPSGLNSDKPLLLMPQSGSELDEYQRDEARALWADAFTSRLTKSCISAMQLLHSGQGKDIWYRDMGVCPTMAEYATLCVEKTGGLFRLIADWVWALHRPIAAAAASAAARTRGGYAVSPSPPISPAMAQRILALCDRFGLCFQILDDYLNLCDDGAGVLKGYCEDIQEGKFSFLVVHAVWTLRQRYAAEANIASTNATDHSNNNVAPTTVAHNGLNSPAETELIALLRERPRGRAEKDVILGILHTCGSFRAAVAAIEAHCDALAAEVRGVDEAIVAAAGATGTRAGGDGVVSGAVAGLLRLVDLMRTRATAAHPCGTLN